MLGEWSGSKRAAFPFYFVCSFLLYSVCRFLVYFVCLYVVFILSFSHPFCLFAFFTYKTERKLIPCWGSGVGKELSFHSILCVVFIRFYFYVPVFILSPSILSLLFSPPLVSFVAEGEKKNLEFLKEKGEEKRSQKELFY